MLILIIAITSLLSIAAFNDKSLMYRLWFNAYQTYHRKEYYRLFTHGFLHGDWMHLFVNMFVLFSFGMALQNNFEYHLGVNGSFYFSVLYFTSIPLASVYSLYKHKDNSGYNALGASGAVSAVLFASVFFDPWNLLYLFAVIPVPGIIFAIAYLFYTVRMSQKGGDNIGHDAHLWGAVYGFIFPLLINPRAISIFIDQLLPF